MVKGQLLCQPLPTSPATVGQHIVGIVVVAGDFLDDLDAIGNAQFILVAQIHLRQRLILPEGIEVDDEGLNAAGEAIAGFADGAAGGIRVHVFYLCFGC